MMYQTLTLALAAVGVSSTALTARQETTPLPADAKFGLMVLRSASPVHFSPFQAALGNLFLALPNMNATCDLPPPSCGAPPPTAPDRATFYLEDETLYLYHAGSGERQRFYTDRSGMGQGKLGYQNETENVPRNSETKGFRLDASNDLTFDGAPFLACPGGIQGSWGLWINVGKPNPADLQDCLGISVRAVGVPNPVSCVYSPCCGF